MAEDQGVIMRINDGLRRWYELKSNDGSGNKYEYEDMFLELCEDNGYEDDEVVEELEENDDQTQLDDEFLENLCPWVEGSNRASTIRKYLNDLRMGVDPSEFTNGTGPQVDPEYFKIRDYEMEKAAKSRQKMASKIMDGGFMYDNTLKYMLAVGDKMKVNYLQLLVDMYLRQFVYYHYENRNKKVLKFNVDAWARENDHIAKKLKNITCDRNGGTADNVAKAAVRSYLHRVAPKLLLHSANRIEGNLKLVAKFIEQTILFVHKKANEKDTTCPFQYDAVFAFQTAVDVEEDAQDDDDDDNDDDDDEDGDGNEDAKVRESPLGDSDVKEVLDQCKLLNETSKWDARLANGDFRVLDAALNPLAEKVKKKMNRMSYPHKFRFCSVVDFRKMKGGDDESKADPDESKDNLFMFHPQEGGDEVTGKVKLTYFHNSKRNIIPNPGNLNDDDEKKNPILASDTHGPQFVLSFHVDELDDMRCYLFINGKCTRFFPPDIKMVLPHFFVESDANKDFVKGDDIDEIINNLDGKLRDGKFAAFLEENKVECPWKKEYVNKKKKKNEL